MLHRILKKKERVNAVSKGWKKHWKQALCKWEIFLDFTILYALITLFVAPIFVIITEKTPNLLFGGITFFITTFLILGLTALDAKDMQRHEEEREREENEFVEQGLKDMQEKERQETEDFYDILSDIEVLVEEHTYDIKEGDEPLLDEVERLLQDIEYIEKKCELFDAEEEEILIQIPQKIRLIVQNYFEVLPIYRKEVAVELLPTIKEKREQLHTMYIKPYQDKVINICKTNTEDLRGNKREYLYIQE